MFGECESLETESLNDQEYDLIDNIPCLSIKSCLERLKNANNIDNKAIIKKLELYLDSLDNYRYEKELRNTVQKIYDLCFNRNPYDSNNFNSDMEKMLINNS